MVEENSSSNASQPFNHLDQLNESIIKIEDMGSFEDDLVDYKSKYRNLKRKLKCLLYEQECFHEELRKLQRKCLRVNRDKSFILDRLLQYEQPDVSSDDEVTSSSEEERDSVKTLNVAKSKNKSSTPRNQNSNKSAEKNSKSTLNTIAGDKVRCRRIENGKQCSKLVSIKVKSGICYTHRQQLNAQKQGPSSSKSAVTSKTLSPKGKSDKLPKQFTGGKDIGQIREAMEANALLESSTPGLYGEEEDDLVIDLPQ